ncbi:MAG: RDD family protein [Microbacteriaceae bacterium]
MPETATSSDWPGKRLGLPEEGPRSVGRLGRRLAALAIDWAIAVVISVAFFEYDPFATLAIFAAAQLLFQWLTNGSIGHLIMRMRVVPVTGGYLGVWRPVVRTLLICLVIPAVIWDTDQRGLHDRAAGTVLVRV